MSQEIDSLSHIHSSPKKQRWLVPAAAGISYGAFTYLIYRKSDGGIQKFVQRSRTSLSNDVSKTVGSFGHGTNQAILWAGTTITSLALRDKRLEHTATVWGGSLLINSVITDQLKKTFQRHRPNTGDSPYVFDWRNGKARNHSLPSGHTSNAFTAAIVFATMYKDKKWVPPTAYTLATLVGLSRIHDNAHWASDVLAGAAVGFLSAKAGLALYKTVARKVQFLPYYQTNAAGIQLSYLFK